MECVLLVLGRGDDQEALPGGKIFHRGELAANALAVAWIKGEEADQGKLASGAGVVEMSATKARTRSSG